MVPSGLFYQRISRPFVVLVRPYLKSMFNKEGNATVIKRQVMSVAQKLAD